MYRFQYHLGFMWARELSVRLQYILTSRDSFSSNESLATTMFSINQLEERKKNKKLEIIIRNHSDK